MKDRGIARCAVELRAGSDLGATQVGGLRGRHHFCFAAYQRADRVRWGALRALNHYRLEAGSRRTATFHAGFEILTLVTSGRLRRTGTFKPARLLGPGSAELVSAGIGADLGVEAIGEEVEYLELWIAAGPALARARRQFRPVGAQGLEQPLASGAAAEGNMLALDAEAQVHRIGLERGESAKLWMGEDICAYGVVLQGAVVANDVCAAARDGFAIAGPGRLVLKADAACNLLLVRTKNLE